MGSDEAYWKRVVDSNRDYIQATDAFLCEVHEPLEFVRRGLHGNVVEILTALGLLPRFTRDECMSLLQDLLGLCISQKFSQAAQKVILTLPKDWLAANIWNASEPVLKNTDHLGYLMLLGLYEKIDPPLAMELAKLAIKSDDQAIHEVGSDYLKSRSK